jgi:hypothetical protein
MSGERQKKQEVIGKYIPTQLFHEADGTTSLKYAVKVFDNSRFIVPLLYWTLSIVWSLFNIYILWRARRRPEE